MSMSERRKLRREARRATLQSVASAPSFKATRKRRTKRSPLRRGLIASTFAAVIIAVVMGAPKLARADGGVPEIDPGSMAGALTLLVGGVLSLTDRIRRV